MLLSQVFRNGSPAADSQVYGDWLGVTASVACAIHCAAMPFVVGFLPLLGLSFLADPSFHQWMVAVCLVLALVAFIPGWRRHGRWTPALIGIFGLSLISLAAFAGPHDCCASGCAINSDSSTVTVASATGITPSIVPASGLESAAATAPSCCPPASTVVSCCSGSDATGGTDGSSVVLTTGSCCPSATASDAGTSASCCSPPLTAGAGSSCGGSEASCCDPATMDAEIATAGIVGWIWLLMTPLGGVVLVAGHLSNRWSSCRCGKNGCGAVGKA